MVPVCLPVVVSMTATRVEWGSVNPTVGSSWLAGKGDVVADEGDPGADAGGGWIDGHGDGFDGGAAVCIGDGNGECVLLSRGWGVGIGCGVACGRGRSVGEAPRVPVTMPVSRLGAPTLGVAATVGALFFGATATVTAVVPPGSDIAVTKLTAWITKWQRRGRPGYETWHRPHPGAGCTRRHEPRFSVADRPPAVDCGIGCRMTARARRCESLRA